MEEDNRVVIALRGEGDTWVTTIIVTELDALRIRNLRPSTRSTQQIELPSVDGYARVEGETLELVFKDGASQDMISAPFVYARDVIDRAIEEERTRVAAERRSAAAWQRIWEWAAERSEDARWLRIEIGERVDATLLMNESEHIAVSLSDSSVAIASVANEDAIPPIGSRITLERDATGDMILSSQ